MKKVIILLQLLITTVVYPQEWKKVYDEGGYKFVDGELTAYGYQYGGEGKTLIYIASTDNGYTWQKAEVPHPDDKGNGYEILYFKPPCIFTYTKNKGIINSTFDMGKTWTSFQLTDYHPSKELNTDYTIVEKVRKVEDDYYAICRKGIMRFNKSDNSWKFVNGLKGYLEIGEEEYPNNIEIKYGDIVSTESELLVIVNDNNYKKTLISSTDNGLTWTTKASSISAFECTEANQFHFIADNNKLYFWGIEGCLLYSEDKGTTFKKLNTITEWVNVISTGQVLAVGGYSKSTEFKPEVAYSVDNGMTFTKLKKFYDGEGIPIGMLVLNNRIIVSINSSVWVYNL